MMSIAELTQSKGYKNFMKYVYGWGASIVLVGALFKIQHYPGASIMLIIGLLTEALIFFFSAFEPLAEELDWTLVFPQLAGLEDDDEEGDKPQRPAREFDRVQSLPVGGGNNQGGGSVQVSGGGVQATGGATGGAAPVGGGVQGGGVIYAGGSASALAKFDEMIEKAEITPGMFEKLGKGLANLNKTIDQLGSTVDINVATQDFVTKMNSATESVSGLGDAYKKSTEALSASVGVLSETYANTAQSFNQSNNQIAEAYSQFANKLTTELSSVDSLGSDYAEKLSGVNKNLSALNSVYELQLQNMNKQVEASKSYFDGLGNMLENMNKTVDNTKKLNEGVQQLEKNVESLNSVYGNMLSSLNIK
ncbi:MAG: gliding motility protein GldL [Salinivirgaceae bacterium]|nr:gliding motility protein GldL [Salinivirgaceae bacterium]MBR5166743.1 gliding motility protein GldL [Salinivirgaceae bacterium]